MFLEQLSSMNKRKGLSCLLALSFACMGTGCSTLSKNSGSGSQDWSISKLWKKEYQIPQQVAVIWSPDVLTMPGKPPTRGFGGRVFFYNERSQAIPVEGELIVHGYLGDPESGAMHEQSDKTFIFTAEQLTNHFSPSQLGASYSVWIPWDDARGYQQQVSLIPTFKTKEGLLVQGAPAKLMLPGKSLEANGTTSDLPVQTISFQQSSTPTNNGVKLPEFGSNRDWSKKEDPSEKPRMRTTTIEVPRGASLTNRRPAQRLTLELGAGRGNPASEPSTSGENEYSQGVSVGGAATRESPQVPNSTPLPTFPSVPSGTSVQNQASAVSEIQPASHESAQVRSLPPPGRSGKSPFAQRPLPKSSNFVRQASFFESQEPVRRNIGENH